MSHSKTILADVLGNPWVATLCLALAMLLAFPVFAYYAFETRGEPGVWAAAVAGAVCWISATIALALTSLFRGTPAAVQGILLSMLFRAGLPLAAGVLLSRGVLAEGGVFGLIVGYYLLGLLIETLLSVCVVNAGANSTKTQKTTS